MGVRINDNGSEMENVIFNVGEAIRDDSAIDDTRVVSANDDNNEESDMTTGLTVQHDPSIDDGTVFTQETGVPNDIEQSNEKSACTIEDNRNRFSKRDKKAGTVHRFQHVAVFTSNKTVMHLLATDGININPATI